jgi:hypothetical protein
MYKIYNYAKNLYFLYAHVFGHLKEKKLQLKLNRYCKIHYPHLKQRLTAGVKPSNEYIF